MRPTVILVGSALFALLAGSAAAQSVRLVSKHANWTLYASDGSPTICFISTQPQSTEPKGASRDSIHFYVAGWPRDKVANEISVKIGYPLRRGSEVTVAVGTTTFKLFAANDRAFVASADDEAKLLDALRKGSSMVVQGTSERGTTTKDTYSLAGISQALQNMTSACQ